MPTTGKTKWEQSSFTDTRKLLISTPTTNGFIIDDTDNDTLRYFSFGSPFNDLQGDSYHAFDICVKGASTTGKPSAILSHPAFSTVVDASIPGSGVSRPSTTGAVVLSFSTELGKGVLSSYRIFFNLGGGTIRTVQTSGPLGNFPSMNSLGEMTVGLVFNATTGLPISVNPTNAGALAPRESNIMVLYPDNIFGAGGFSGGLNFSDYVTANGTIAAGKLLLSKILSISVIKKYERKTWKTSFSLGGLEYSYSTNPTYRSSKTIPIVGIDGVKYRNIATWTAGSVSVVPTYAGLYDERDELCAVVTLPKFAISGVGAANYTIHLPRYE